MSLQLKDKHEALAFKLSLERSFESASGLADRRYYSAFCALPQNSPLLWLNLNPGGTMEDHQILSDEELLAGKHEFFHGYGKTSVATGAFLRSLFPRANESELCSIQGSNVAWERSSRASDIDLQAAARTASPFLHQLILMCRPSHLVFGGAQARELYLKTGRAESLSISRIVHGNWGNAQARIFIAETMQVEGAGALSAITVSHPSRGVRKAAFEAAREELMQIDLPESLASK